ncbi:amidohydrolase 2 [Obba rivulosa]|uniref:6-methylsalicylate decarboxylase n=1 Tax=Obba rivulosa TaxID=1052685 RepID=A0A8E2DQY3_9APHY|nr:amidohydrolase 2 [Obba rivulosa]
MSEYEEQTERPLCIDVHHHLFPGNLQKANQSARVGFRTPPENLPWSPEVSLKAMDALGIDLAILSLPPGLPAGAAGPENRSAAREYNILMSSICDRHPGRFGFFACLPIPSDSEAAVAEVAFALDELHADGVALASSYGNASEATYIADDAYDTVWHEINRRGAVVFLHGAQVPSSTPYPHPFLGIPITEVPNETFKAAAHFVVAGKRRRFPNVKVILAHMGGTLPSLAPRVAALSSYMGCSLSPEEIIQDFGSFYYDTALTAHHTTLTAIETLIAPNHLLFGSDFPAVDHRTVDWYTKNVNDFYANDPEQLAKVLWKNTSLLLPATLSRLVNFKSISDSSHYPKRYG